MYWINLDFYNSLSFLKKEINFLDRDIIISYVYNINKNFLSFYLYYKVNYKSLKKIFTLIERFLLKEPLSYLIEQAEFYSFPIYVNKSVLIPRKESEFIIDYVLNTYKYNNNISSILDLGSGSGIFPIILKKKLKNLVFHSLDISHKALKVAIKNKKILLGAKNAKKDIFFFRSNLFSLSIFNKKNFIFDLILSNPPYISNSEFKCLMNNVICYEPKIALLAKNNGLEFYKKIAKKASKNLKNINSEIIVEIPWNKALEITQIFYNYKYIRKLLIKDYSNLDRILVFRRIK